MGDSEVSYIQPTYQANKPAPPPPPEQHVTPPNPSIEERAEARTSGETPAQPINPISQLISDTDQELRRAHVSLSADNGNLRELNRQKQESGLLSWAFGTSAAIDREIIMTEEQKSRNETRASRLEIFCQGLKSAEGLLSKEELSPQDRLDLARVIVEQEDLKSQIHGVSRGNSQQRITELAEQDSQSLMSRFEKVAEYNAQALNIGNSQHYREELNNQRQGLRDVRADYDAAGNRIEIAETGTRIVRDASLVAGTTVAGVAAAPVIVAGAAAVGITGIAAVAGTTAVGVTATGTAAGLTLATAENVATGLSDAVFNEKSAAQIIEERVDQMKSDTSLVFSTAAATGVAVATGGAGNAMLGTRASSGLARVGIGAVSGAAAGETGYVVNTGISYAGAVREFNELTKAQALTPEQSAQAWSEFSAQRGLDAESMAWGALKSAGLGAVGGTIGYGGASVRAGLDSTAAKAASFVAEEVLTTGICLAPAAYLYSQGKITQEELIQMGFQDFVTGIVSNVAGETAHAALNANHSRAATAGTATDSQAAAGVAAAAPMAAKAVADAVNPVRTTDAQRKPVDVPDTKAARPDTKSSKTDTPTPKPASGRPGTDGNPETGGPVYTTGQQAGAAVAATVAGKVVADVATTTPRAADQGRFQPVNGLRSYLPTAASLSRLNPWGQKPITAAAKEQSWKYRGDGFIPAGERILDGFQRLKGDKMDKHGNHVREDYARGETWRLQERLTVDRSKDPVLSAMIKDVACQTERTRHDLDKILILFEEVKSRLGGDTDGPTLIKNIERVVSQSKDLNVLLGEFIHAGAGVCRHRALLFKIIGDEIGLDVTLNKGTFIGNMRTEHVPRIDRNNHAWNITRAAGVLYLVDSMHDNIFDMLSVNRLDVRYYRGREEKPNNLSLFE